MAMCVREHRLPGERGWFEVKEDLRAKKIADTIMKVFVYAFLAVLYAAILWNT